MTFYPQSLCYISLESLFDSDLKCVAVSPLLKGDSNTGVFL